MGRLAPCIRIMDSSIQGRSEAGDSAADVKRLPYQPFVHPDASQSDCPLRSGSGTWYMRQTVSWVFGFGRCLAGLADLPVSRQGSKHPSSRTCRIIPRQHSSRRVRPLPGQGYSQPQCVGRNTLQGRQSRRERTAKNISRRLVKMSQPHNGSPHPLSASTFWPPSVRLASVATRSELPTAAITRSPHLYILAMDRRMSARGAGCPETPPQSATVPD